MHVVDIVSEVQGIVCKQLGKTVKLLMTYNSTKVNAVFNNEVKDV